MKRLWTSGWMLIALGALVVTSGCRSTRSGRRDTPAPRAVEERDVDITFSLDSAVGEAGDDVTLHGTWKGVPGNAEPLLLFVPGAGRVSRRGVRKKNGSRAYDGPVPVVEQFASHAAYTGFQTLAYDKRTCGPVESPLCARNPSPDWDAQGPVALTRDVDAACATARKLAPGVPLVVVAHGQSANVVLASSCAKTADALLLIAPIPGAVDEVLVRGLQRRSKLLRKWGEEKLRSSDPDVAAEGEQQVQESVQLQNRAANFAGTFKQIKDGAFDDDAQVLGATPVFWRGYFAFTEQVFEHAQAANDTPRVVVLGQWDSQYAPADKNRIAQLAEGHRFVVVDKADHHLLVDKQLSDEVFDEVLQVLTETLQNRPSS